jgi:hypothetical protein
MLTLLAQAEHAVRCGDSGRAVALAREAIAAGAPVTRGLRVTVDALAALLRRTGLLGGGLGRGPVRPRDLREGVHGEPMRDAVEQLQIALIELGAAGAVTAREEMFALAMTVADLEVVRRPAGPPSPSRIVLSMACCERPALLRRTLDDLLRSDMPPADLVFLEDASRDSRVLSLLAALDGGPHRVHLIANRGFSTRFPGVVHNQVIHYAQRQLGGFETLVICDADMALAPDWWARVDEVRRVLDGRTLPEGRLGVVTAFHAQSSHPARRELSINGVRVRIKESFGACHLVVPAEVYKTVLGRFDHHEDWGWSARLVTAGRFVAATHPSRVQHVGDESLLFHAVIDRAQDYAC